MPNDNPKGTEKEYSDDGIPISAEHFSASGIVAILEHVLKAVASMGTDFRIIVKGFNFAENFTAIQKIAKIMTWPPISVKITPAAEKRVPAPVVIIIEATEQNTTMYVRYRKILLSS